MIIQNFSIFLGNYIKISLCLVVSKKNFSFLVKSLGLFGLREKETECEKNTVFSHFIYLVCKKTLEKKSVFITNHFPTKDVRK